MEPDQATKWADQAALAAALAKPAVYGPTIDQVEKLETHISYVFLAGKYAYKIKKAVDLGFLDFRTLRARKFYCHEELRLNRRLAPALYLDVVPITGSPGRPVLGGEGSAIEYAVKMRRFPQEVLLNRMLAHSELTPEHIDQLTETIAAFHATAAVASADDTFGTPPAIRQPALENFAQIKALADADDATADLDVLEQWTAREGEALDAVFKTRKQNGFVRECHGDFHLRNAAVVDGRVTIFDCLEFNANLRWIDVMNEVAFMAMDLHDRARPDLAWRFLNRYLETTGDYDGLRVLRFYVVYRALVRAKVHRMRAAQPNVRADERTRVLAQYHGYVDLARSYIAKPRAAIFITHGLSGSGKTTGTQQLLAAIGAIRIRSDVERKRLQRLSARARTGSGIDAGTYSADATERTYRRLLELTRTIALSGYNVIVDAAFLKRAQRDGFRKFADAAGIPFLILDFVADKTTLRARINERQKQRRDASEADIAVLEHQLQTHEPLQPDERSVVLTYGGCDSSDFRDPLTATRSWLAAHGCYTGAEYVASLSRRTRA